MVIKNRLIVSLLFLVVLLAFAGTGWSVVNLPTANFTGPIKTSTGIGTGELLFDDGFGGTAFITMTNYQNGDFGFENDAVESIIGATVAITNAYRIGPFAFDDAIFTVSAGGFTYFSATLNNIEFTTDGFYWYLNPDLNIDNPSTLNLSNIILNTDATHPSRYIDELRTAFASQTIAGMKMTFFSYLGDVTGDSDGIITDGVIDGTPAITNTPPVANAGNDITIPGNQVASTTVQGIVTDADAAYTLTCRWTETDVSGNVLSVLQDWTPVGISGECPLSLGALSLGLGVHTLTLEANDGEETSSDNMILTINNSGPNANAGNDITITSEEVAATTIQGAATDFDNGDMLYCKWTEGATVLQDWTLAGANGACPLSGLTLGRGTHNLTLEATDGQATSSDNMVLTINNTPPVANAGENITVTSDQIGATAIQGTATDFDGDVITCRWTEGVNVLQNWTPAGLNGECVLSLNTLSFSLGAHTLTFEASDGQATSSNNMILTVNNSAPHAAPGGSGVYEINIPVILPGDVSDFDGDLLYYEWTDGTNALCSGNIQSLAGGTSVLLPDCIVSNLGLGTHTVSLQVSDGFNPPDVKNVTVQIVDSSAPKLQPVANKYILWPPNHKMVDIAIAANASDNSGCPVTLNATVASNEPQFGLGSGDTGPDWTQPVIDQTTGMIYFQLRAERSGRGKGRIYTITITATDCSGNISTAKVKIRVPHDQDNDDRKREDREEHDRDDRHDKKDCRDDRDD